MSTKSHKSLHLRASGATPATQRQRKKRTELSNMVTRRARETAALVASIRVHKAEVAAALGERWAPVLREGEAVPDHALSLELASRSVELAFERLDELDDKHHFARAERAHLAREFDGVARQKLYPQAVAVRRQIDDALGREAGSALHTFTGKTPRTPARLMQHVERAVSRLGKPGRHLPDEEPMQSLLESGRAERWRRRLEDPLRELAAVDEQLGRLTAELHAISSQRKQAMQHFDAAYTEALHLAEAAYRMAGVGGKMIKSLRSYHEQRRLIRWARQKREARADGLAAVPAAAESVESSQPAPAWRLSTGAVAAVTKWLKTTRVFAWRPGKRQQPVL